MVKMASGYLDQDGSRGSTLGWRRPWRGCGGSPVPVLTSRPGLGRYLITQTSLEVTDDEFSIQGAV
jgi:hypothetical protein